MNCEERFEQISAYVDHALEAAQEGDCERHLFECATCRETYRALRGLRWRLRAEPAEATLPLHLELALGHAATDFLGGDDAALTAMAEDFVASGEVGVVEREEAPRDALDARQVFAWLTRMRRRIVAAAAVLLATLVGMGLLAHREGSAPTLTVVGYRVSGLSDFGHALLSTHERYEERFGQEADHGPETLSFLFERQARADIVLPSAPFGVAVDGRVLEFDDALTPVARYRAGGGWATLFMMSSARALGAFDEGSGEGAEPGLCAQPERSRCVEDGRGTSVCVIYEGEQAQVWVAPGSAEALRERLEARGGPVASRGR